MRAKKIDNNQNLIVLQLRKIGCSVAVISMVGHGVPNLLIGFRGKNFLIELKDGSKSASRKRLTSSEKDWHLIWRGQVATAENFDEILKIIESI